MTGADWMTEANMAFVTERRALGYSAEWIAARLHITKGAIVGVMRRRGIRPDESAPKTTIAGIRPKVTDFWSGVVAPAWRTQEADDVFVTLWTGNVPVSDICNFFDINDEQVRARRDALGLTPRGVSQIKPGTGAMVWGSPEADAELEKRWGRGDKEAVIREFFGVGRGSFHSRKIKVGLLPRIAVAVVEKRLETRAVPVTRRPVAAPPVISRTITQTGGNRQSMYSAGINWGVVNSIKIERTPGVCSWPLDCTETTQARFCEHHAGLLGKRAAL